MGRCVLLCCLLLSAAGCRDTDMQEMVGDEYTYAMDKEYPTATNGRANQAEASATEILSERELTDRSDMHAPGQRNASTAWFFQQPWAARVYWGKRRAIR